MTLRRLLILLALVLIPRVAVAQNQPVFQAGTITVGHAPIWVAPGVVSDAGSAASGNLTELGITATGTPLCINDALVSSPGGYHQLCFGALALGGGIISYQAYGGATALPLLCDINGLTQNCLGNTVSGLAVATSNAVLMATSTTAGQTSILRLGVNNPGDAPPLLFTASGSPCTISGGDIGSQVTSSNGLCWLAQYTEGVPINPLEFGAKLNGATDDTTTFLAAINYGPATTSLISSRNAKPVVDCGGRQVFLSATEVIRMPPASPFIIATWLPTRRSTGRGIFRSA